MKQRLINLFVRRRFRHFLWVSSGNLGGNALNLLSTVIITRTLSPHAYGIFAALVALMMWMAQFTDLGLGVTIVKYYKETLHRYGEESAEKILHQAFKLKLVLLLVTLALGLIFAGPLGIHWLHLDEAGLVRWAVLGGVGTSLWMFCQACMQSREHFRLYSIQTFANHLVRFVCVLIVLKTHHLTIFSALVIAVLVPWQGVVGSFLRWPAAFWSGASTAPAETVNLGEIFHFSKWIMFSFTINSFSMNAGPLQLAYLTNQAEVGYYRVAEQCAQVLGLVAAALSTVMLPRLSTDRDRDNIARQVMRFVKLTPLIAVGGFVMYVAARILIPVVFRAAYRPSIPVFGWLLVAYLLMLVINPLSLICLAYGKSRWLAYMNAAQAVIILSLNRLLIPHWGAVGAAVSYLVMCIIALGSVGLMLYRLYLTHSGDRPLMPAIPD